MSIHCKLGDSQAIVSYKFSNSNNKSIAIKNTPIEVTTKKRVNRETENFSSKGFGIRFYSPNNRNWQEVPIHDYIIYSSPDFDFGPNYEGIALWVCGAQDFYRNPDGSLNGTGIDVTTLSFPPNLKCPQPLDYNPDNVCIIDIKHNGSIVFSDIGNCPVNYNVVCGEECPPDTVKCHSNNYPGYCCLPCSEIKGEIQAITSQVKRLNNG